MEDGDTFIKNSIGEVNVTKAKPKRCSGQSPLRSKRVHNFPSLKALRAK